MSWFGKKTNKTTPAQLENRQAIVEIEAHKDAQKEAIAAAKEASQKLNTLLVENGFTLKIYLATGGHVRTKKGE